MDKSGEKKKVNTYFIKITAIAAFVAAVLLCIGIALTLAFRQSSYKESYADYQSGLNKISTAVSDYCAAPLKEDYEFTATLSDGKITINGEAAEISGDIVARNLEANRVNFYAYNEIFSSDDAKPYLVISEEDGSGRKLYFYSAETLLKDLGVQPFTGACFAGGSGRILGSEEFSGYLSDYGVKLKNGVTLVNKGGATFALTLSKVEGGDFFVVGWDDFSGQKKATDALLAETIIMLAIAGGLLVAAFFTAECMLFPQVRQKRDGTYYRVETDRYGKVIKADDNFRRDFARTVTFFGVTESKEGAGFKYVCLKSYEGEDIDLACRVKKSGEKYVIKATKLRVDRNSKLATSGEKAADTFAVFKSRSSKVLVGKIMFTDLENIKQLFGSSLAAKVRSAAFKKVTDKFVYTFVEDFATVSILYPGGKELDELLQDMAEIVTFINKPIQCDDNTVKLGGKFGFAIADDMMAEDTYEYAMVAADAALNRALGEPMKDFFIFHESQKKQYAKYFLSYDIPQMLENNEFELHYQPQYSIKEGRIVGFEALFRIKSNTQVNIFDLIVYAERTGKMILLGNFIFDTGMRFAKSIEDRNVSVSLNVSPVQLMQAGFVDNFLKIYKKYDLKPGSICVEITESFLMETFDETIKKLQLLREAGINIHLDDFGTRYSSLLYLKKLPISDIKIDKEFVDDVCTNEYSRVVAEMILGVTKELDLSCVIEGVESREQLAVLRELGGDIIQGYLVSKPVRQDAALALLNSCKNIF